MKENHLKIIINASNLHNGGGIQVATSFLYELNKTPQKNFIPTVYISSEIAQELTKLGVNIKKNNWIVYNTYGIKNYFKNKMVFSKFDIVFTIFGPYYFRNSKQKSITGFAQAWIIYPNNEAFKKLSFLKKIKSRFKFFLQKKFFQQSDILIVELDHVKKQLEKLKILKPNNIKVVKNSFSSIYLDQSKWTPLQIDLNKNLKLGFIGRDYPHKNLSILPDIKKILQDKYKITADFYVTLNNSEWAARNYIFKEAIINIGSLSTSECPNFYKKMDALIFPSLLECFSATPLEAMITKTPVFASDRNFVKDVCGDYAYYFDPLNPNQIAEVIAKYFSSPIEMRDQLINNAYKHAIAFSSSEDRAQKYINIIKNSSIN